MSGASTFTKAERFTVAMTSARREFDLVSADCDYFITRAKKLEAENAKLRKMVHALLQCHIEDTDTCSKCDFRSPLHGGCMADVMADELGIEVDG